MPPLKNRLMSDTLKKIAEKRGMIAPHTATVKKPIPADSAAPDKSTYYDLRKDVPTSKDKGMKKDLGLTPYYYERSWDEVTHSYVTVPRRLIKKT